MRHSTILVILLVTISSSFADPSPADLVLRNARVYTLDPAHPWVDAIAIKGDRIVFVGDTTGLPVVIGPDTHVIDLGGRMVLPGFIDTHMHLMDTLAFAEAAELSPDMDRTQILAALRAHAKKYPQQDPLLGRGFLGLAFGEEGPTAATLDKIVPDRAAFIYDEGGHTAWVNSAALQRAGVNKHTPDPEPGAHFYKRYPDGSPTGWLIEGGAFEPVSSALNVISTKSILSGADIYFPILSSMGITAVFDAGLPTNTHLAMSALETLREAEQLPLRVVASYYVNTKEKLADAIEQVDELHEQFNQELLDLSVLKLSLDGTVEARTAYLLAPWLNETVNTTSPAIPRELTASTVLAAARKDMDIHLHALGDGAVRFALDMVEQVRLTLPDSRSRFTICHLQVVNPADVGRFAELNVIAQSTPSWYVYDDVALEFLGEPRFSEMYPLQGMATAGARLTFGSDYPASWIGLDGLNPLFNIEMAMTRQQAGGRGTPVQPAPAQRVSLEQAIRAYTLDAAYQLRLEQDIGSIEAGKKADIVVLDKNLFTTDVYEIHQARVELTIMNGRVIYDRLGLGN